METRSQPDIPDPEIDRVFMGEALRQAAKAYEDADRLTDCVR